MADKDESRGTDDHHNGPVQAVARGLGRWLAMLSIGLGLLGAATAYMGLLALASLLVSIVVVVVALYLFIRYWPEDEPLQPKAPVAAPPAEPSKRSAMVQAVQLDCPPKARIVMALRDMTRRQEAVRISPQGAERFARTIRYILRNAR